MSNVFDILNFNKDNSDKDHGDEIKSAKVSKDSAPAIGRQEKTEHSPQVPQPQPSPSKHDRVLDVDSLRAFTIPKARKQKRKLPLQRFSR